MHVHVYCSELYSFRSVVELYCVVSAVTRSLLTDLNQISFTAVVRTGCVLHSPSLTSSCSNSSYSNDPDSSFFGTNQQKLYKCLTRAYWLRKI